MKPWSVCSLFFCAPCGPNGSLPCCHGTRWGTGTPYFLGITLWLRNFCKAVQSLKTGCLTISPGIVQTAGHSALPPACFIISARLPSPSSPFCSPIQGNLPLVQEKTLLKTHSTKSYLYPKSSGFFPELRFQKPKLLLPLSLWYLVISLPLGNDSRGLSQVRQYRKSRESKQGRMREKHLLIFLNAITFVSAFINTWFGTVLFLNLRRY